VRGCGAQFGKVRDGGVRALACLDPAFAPPAFDAEPRRQERPRTGSAPAALLLGAGGGGPERRRAA
jgi:hypothetical protein